jgi:hypothetical protein
VDAVTAWWADIPLGYYAWDIVYQDDDYPVVGYTTFRRSPKGFRLGATYRLPANDLLPEPDRRDYVYDMAWTVAAIRDLVPAVIRDADKDRARFGQLTGRCGCCSRVLTDPRSKLRGIGPDCWAGLGGAA